MVRRYFTMFCLANSASLSDNLWYNLLGVTAGKDLGYRFKTPAAFQKALWWYNGGILYTGVMGMPPVLSAAELRGEYDDLLMANLRSRFPNSGDTAVPWNASGFWLLGQMTDIYMYMCMYMYMSMSFTWTCTFFTVTPGHSGR